MASDKINLKYFTGGFLTSANILDFNLQLLHFMAHQLQQRCRYNLFPNILCQQTVRVYCGFSKKIDSLLNLLKTMGS